jgi:hypothetical protein
MMMMMITIVAVTIPLPKWRTDNRPRQAGEADIPLLTPASFIDTALVAIKSSVAVNLSHASPIQDTGPYRSPHYALLPPPWTEPKTPETYENVLGDDPR